MFGLDGDRDPQDGRRRWLPIGLGLVAAVVAMTIVLFGPGSADPPTAHGAAATTTPPSAVPTASATPSAQPTPASPSLYEDPTARADLEAVAAGLTTPVVLSSPAEWDQWLPEGKPFPGADTAEDLATCPKLADRLGAALGQEMSYWTGTLPQGPSGCTWVPVPLTYGPDPYDYAYLASVGFLADGTTTEQLSGGFFHHQGRICPSAAVPSAGEGAYLVRCEELGGVSYAVLTRDARTDGIWVLTATARADASHSAVDVLQPVLDGVVAAYG
jgi:hypothetical protein